MIRETQLKATDGATLYAWFREPPGERQAAVVAHVHGMGEHSRRYNHVTAYWESIGWASAGFDLRGFFANVHPACRAVIARAPES